MTEECAMIWLSLVENYAYVAVSLGISLHLEIFDPVATHDLILLTVYLIIIIIILSPLNGMD